MATARPQPKVVTEQKDEKAQEQQAAKEQAVKQDAKEQAKKTYPRQPGKKEGSVDQGYINSDVMVRAFIVEKARKQKERLNAEIIEQQGKLKHTETQVKSKITGYDLRAQKQQLKHQDAPEKKLNLSEEELNTAATNMLKPLKAYKAALEEHEQNKSKSSLYGPLYDLAKKPALSQFITTWKPIKDNDPEPVTEKEEQKTQLKMGKI